MATFRNLSLQYWSRDEQRYRQGQPVTRRITRKEVKLVEAYRAVWRDKHGITHKLVAVQGYVCDLSSIPRVFQSIVPKVGLHDGPSVIHDLCYEHLWRSRWASDCLFLEAMKHTGVRWLRRKAIFTAVRAGGWVTWNKRKRQQRQ